MVFRGSDVLCFKPEELVSFSVAIQTSYVKSRNSKPVNDVLR
jgi:hypothetical protein